MYSLLVVELLVPLLMTFICTFFHFSERYYSLLYFMVIVRKATTIIYHAIGIAREILIQRWGRGLIHSSESCSVMHEARKRDFLGVKLPDISAL